MRSTDIRRRFRSLDRDVSVIGFGTWAMGGESTLGGKQLGWGPTDGVEAERAVHLALDRGIDFFDTADVYGNGASERALGAWLVGRDVVVCTKFGNREENGRAFQDFSESWLRKSVDGSLRRLRRDRLDVLLLHSPPDDFDWAGYDVAPFEALRREGKIGAYGVSCRSTKGARRVVDARFGSVLEVIYNAWDRRAEELLPCGYDLVARVPLGSGFLGGASTATFSRTDYRSALPDAELAWRLQAARKLSFLAEEPGGVAVSALRFCLSRPEITTVIPGMRKRTHVEANLLAADLGPLDGALVDRIEKAVPNVYEGWKT